MFTCGQEDGIRLGIAAVDHIAALGHALYGGARLVGHALPGERQHGGAGLAARHPQTLGVLNGDLHRTAINP